MAKDLEKAYHHDIEPEIYSWWEKEGFFRPEKMVELGLVTKDSPRYCITIPLLLLYRNSRYMYKRVFLQVKEVRVHGCGKIGLPVLVVLITEDQHELVQTAFGHHVEVGLPVFRIMQLFFKVPSLKGTH